MRAAVLLGFRPSRFYVQRATGHVSFSEGDRGCRVDVNQERDVVRPTLSREQYSWTFELVQINVLHERSPAKPNPVRFANMCVRGGDSNPYIAHVAGSEAVVGSSCRMVLRRLGRVNLVVPARQDQGTQPHHGQDRDAGHGRPRPAAPLWRSGLARLGLARRRCGARFDNRVLPVACHAWMDSTKPTFLDTTCALPCLSHLDRRQTLAVEVPPDGSRMDEQLRGEVLRPQPSFAARTFELKGELVERRTAARRSRVHTSSEPTRRRSTSRVWFTVTATVLAVRGGPNTVRLGPTARNAAAAGFRRLCWGRRS